MYLFDPCAGLMCGDCILENSVLRAGVTKRGLIKSLVHKLSLK